MPRISATRAAWAVRCRAWRSSRPGAGCSRKGVRCRRARPGPARAPGRRRRRRVAERIPGDRLQHVRPGPPRSQDPPARAAQDRGERGERGRGSSWASASAAAATRISPRSRSCSPSRPGLPGPTGLAEADQGVHEGCWDPGDLVVRPGEPRPATRQPSGGERRGVTVCSSSSVWRMTRNPSMPRAGCRRLRVRSARWTHGSASSGCPCDTSTSADDHAGNARRRVAGPAVPLGQLHRRPAALGRPRERVVDLVRAW